MAVIQCENRLNIVEIDSTSLKHHVFLENVALDTVHIQHGTDSLESIGSHCSKTVVSEPFEIVVLVGRRTTPDGNAIRSYTSPNLNIYIQV